MKLGMKVDMNVSYHILLKVWMYLI